MVEGGANLRLTADMVDSAVGDADIIIAGFEITDEGVAAAASQARKGGSRFILNPSPVRPIVAGLLGPGDILVLNEHERSQIAQTLDLGRADDMTLSAALGGCDLVVTLGARGARALDAAHSHLVEVPGIAIRPVDTTGCGDAFLGALAAEVASGRSVAEATAFAVKVGAFAAMRMGSQPSYPSRPSVTAPSTH